MISIGINHANIIKRNKEYTGLEHRQTLRACEFNCDLQIDNWELEIWKVEKNLKNKNIL